MGKVSLSNPTLKESVTSDKTKLLPSLTKKELITLVSTTIVLLTIGFVIGFFVNYSKLRKIENTLSQIDPLIQLKIDLNDKLLNTSKQLNKIEDEDLYKVVMEKKGKKIEQIKEQIESINKFKIKQSNEVQIFILNKKDELKQKEILYHR